jgi:hypothetical protein
MPHFGGGKRIDLYIFGMLREQWQASRRRDKK